MQMLLEQLHHTLKQVLFDNVAVVKDLPHPDAMAEELEGGEDEVFVVRRQLHRHRLHHVVPLHVVFHPQSVVLDAEGEEFYDMSSRRVPRGLLHMHHQR